MKPIFGALARAFLLVSLFALVLFPLAAFAQTSVVAPDPTVTLSKLHAYLFFGVTALGGMITFCGMLAHYFPPTTRFGKIVSWLAFNGGKALQELNELGLVEKRPPAAPPSVGMARLGVLVALAFLCTTVGACSFFSKEFGPTIAGDLVKCQTAQLVTLEGDLLPDLQSVLATASDAGLGAALADLEARAVAQLGSGALAALKCDAMVIAADYEAAHAAADGGTPAAQMHALVSSVDTPSIVYQRAKAYAAK